MDQVTANRRAEAGGYGGRGLHGEVVEDILATLAEFSVISTRRYGDLHRGRAAA